MGCKVAWNEVCLPTKEGGLGLRKLSEWNKASMLRHLWAICTRRQSLWVNWCHSYLLKGKCFWEIKIPSDCSWTWRKILNLRETAIHISHYKVGNGETISLWYSNWHPKGPLIPKYTARIAYDAGISESAKVSSVISNGHWHWPYPTTWELREIINESPLDYLPSPQPDTFIWRASTDGTYKASTTWNAIRLQAPKVRWHKLIWFPQHVPRFSFITWMAIKGKLSTKDKIVKWGITSTSSCSLCNGGTETASHLFFQCSFSRELRQKIFNLCSITKGNQHWPIEIEWASGKFSKKCFPNTICKIAWTALVYYIWQERNARIFKGTSSTTDVLLQEIKHVVRLKASQMHVKPTDEILNFCNRWEIPPSDIV